VFFQIIFIFSIIGEIFLSIILELLNLNHLKKSTQISDRKLVDIFSNEYLTQTYDYNFLNFILDTISDLVNYSFFLFFIFSDFFIKLNILISNYFSSPILANIIFMLFFGFILYLINLPFEIYKIFYIEKIFGFSTIKIKTFILDNIKMLLLSAFFGSLLLFVVFKFILFFQNSWYIYATIVIIIFQLFIIKIFPTFIAPLFNKFTPLSDENLKEQIKNIAIKSGYSITNIFVSDASKRTKHSNAYFTGFGKNKQIVLFDNLLSQLNNEEILAVISHEIGHYKKKHIWLLFFINVIFQFIMFYLIFVLSYYSPFLSAFKINNTNYLFKFIFTIIWLQVFFWFLSFPITFITRKTEFSADKFSFDLLNSAKPLISALIKLTKDNLSNPYPYHLYSKLYYSHPPLIERIDYLQKL